MSTPSTQSTVACKGCKTEIHADAIICPHCGFSQRIRSYKSKNVAGIMAFLLGGLGVHRFYLGQWWGIFYLLLIWTFIPMLIALIEAIYFWSCNQAKWDNKHNEGKPAAANEKSGGVIIVLVIVVGGFLAVAFLGILAAVSIPAYQDYTIRAKVNAALVETSSLKYQITEHYINNDRLPSSNVELAYEGSTEISGGHLVTINPNGGFTIRFNDESEVLNNKTLIMSPVINNEELSWDCTQGDLRTQHRPSICRQ